MNLFIILIIIFMFVGTKFVNYYYNLDNNFNDNNKDVSNLNLNKKLQQ